MPTSSRFARFVAAVHRRAVGLRVVEGVGIGLACAAVMDLLLLPIGIGWQGAVGVAGAAAVVGAVAGWNRRPTQLAAVIEADTQLNTHDLLSSALTADGDDFGAAVRAMAERATATLSPSQVVLNRLGVRAWGGIGLAWLMVLVVGLLVNGASDTRAEDESFGSRADRTTPRPRVDSTQSPARHGVGAERPVDENTNVGETPSPATSSRGGGERSPTEGQANDGSGGGTAKTDSARVEQGRPGVAPGSASDRGDTAGGSGTAARTGTAGTAGGMTTSSDRQAAPWQSDQWPAARAAALQAVRDGRVPDAYRDLVREYFRTDE